MIKIHCGNCGKMRISQIYVLITTTVLCYFEISAVKKAEIRVAQRFLHRFPSALATIFLPAAMIFHDPTPALSVSG